MTPTFNRRIALLFSAAAVFLLIRAEAFAAKSVSQHGITWTFDRDYPTGQFANGDFWVVGPVKITSITPQPKGGSTVMHGSMINPKPNDSQGYDNRIKGNTYSSTLNVGLKLPLTVQPGSSLLSSQSHTTRVSGDDPQLKTIAILTVLDGAAPAGSFRPPYIGTDKRLRWNKSQLDYSKLRSLPKVSGAPSLDNMEAKFARPWIEQKTNWTGRYMHPSDNQPSYGREVSHAIASGLLSLQLNYTNSEKEKLLVRMVQYGIDIYGASRAGAKWNGDGGHNQGRKMPLLLAAAVLGDADMFTVADAQRSLNFQEDQSTWFVSLYDVGRTLYTADGRPREEYILGDIGTAEWGEKHTVDPRRDGRNWNAYYRTVTGSCTIGHVLTARLMGLEQKWNWPATFDYYDRYWNKEKNNSSSSANDIQPFVANMWKAYRNADGADYTEDNISTDEIWQNASITSQTGSFTVSFDMIPSQNKMEGITGLSTGAADNIADLAAAVRFAPSGYIDAANGSTFQASNSLAYSAGVRYRVVISADLSTDKYSVKVTPAGRSAVTIASGWSFRTEQRSATQITNVGFVSRTGAHSVLDVGATSNSTSTPAPAPEPAPAPSEPETVTTTTSVLRVNAGGAKYTDKSGKVWAADYGYDSGVTVKHSVSIAGTEDDVLYQTNRYDNPRSAALLNYAFSLKNDDYRVRLMFAETSFTANGKRRFDVKAEGKLVIDNLDIHARVGAKRALVIEFPVKITDGKLNLAFIPGVNNPQINGIEVLRAGTTVVSNPAPEPEVNEGTQESTSGKVLFRINAGGRKYVDKRGRTWRADAYYNSGMTGQKKVAIANTSDDALFQTNRYDNPRSAAQLKYRIPVKNGKYQVRLHFAETHYTRNGKRRFDVKAEGKVLVSKLDIHARAGARERLTIEKEVQVTGGALDLHFVPKVGAPQINAIEVIQG